MSYSHVVTEEVTEMKMSFATVIYNLSIVIVTIRDREVMSAA